MRLATVKRNGRETAAVETGDGTVLLEDVNRHLEQSWSTDLFELIATGELDALGDWYRSGGKEALKELVGRGIALKEVEYGPLYRRPRKIWGIGLNYAEHASDLGERAPEAEPASFMKPDTAIIGPGDVIRIPRQSERTTAEAELGIVIGKRCKDISEEEAPEVIAGFTTILDMTAEDILQRNPRYLTRSKSFDTFFSFGPQLVTPDEVGDVSALQVATVLNGQVHRKNTVANMMFHPWYLVSFHSRMMTLLPGDIISTGTPGAVVIRDGDVVECRIDGFPPLVNPVEDMKGEREAP